MKCTDRQSGARARRRQEKKRQQMLAAAMLLAILCVVALIGLIGYLLFFRSHELELTNPYDISSQKYGVLQDADVAVSLRAEPFTKDLCVTAADVSFDSVQTESASAAAIMDLNEHKVLYAKNIHERLYPASLTKIMTALVAIKYGNLDDSIFVDEIALDIDPESSVCYLQYGDEYTLRQLIYGLLIASGNDAGNAIAAHVGGSIEGFVDMMNQEAALIGATNTHFTNAHGLQDENHYTTAYDTYLIFQEALKYDVFNDAINQKAYTVTYKDIEGDLYERTWFATNYYFTGESMPPNGVTVFGGKTGTTDEAGACLALLSKDDYGNSYFSIVMDSDTKENLYLQMNDLLSIINKKEL